MIFTKRYLRLHEGFTLIEFAVVMGLFSGIMTLVLLFSLDIADFSVQFQQDLFAKQEINLTLTSLLTELRSIAPAANGSFPLVAASSTSFTFYADTNADGITERVRYFFSTSTFRKGVIKATGTPAVYATSTEVVNPLISSIATGTFQYYDANYTGTQAAMTSTADISLIRAVKFQVTVDVSTSTRPGPITSSLTVTIRNLRN